MGIPLMSLKVLQYTHFFQAFNVDAFYGLVNIHQIYLVIQNKSCQLAVRTCTFVSYSTI